MSDLAMPSATEAVETPQLSLRERKFARTKLALLESALERMKEKPLADITVRELCDDAEVSEATFFNYFQKKDDLLRYFIQLWTLEVSLVAEKTAGPKGGVAYVEAVFAHTAERIAENPRVMLEIIGHMALHGDPEQWEQELVPLSPAELAHAFPEDTPACAPEDCELDALFRGALERAVRAGELPKDANLDLAVSAVIAIFFGIPLWHTRIRPSSVGELYSAQLKTLWAGLSGARH